ncbi:flavodoxin domain-containing protein [Tsukamurella sp. 8F]|uniref:flavodoxin domain-containing protein n=1 Tax=unclassified Tsukamurella TaxID=2633480 RepID=UPI0023B9DA3E|nr:MULTISPECIES: flavodoxin domain-containing protein [unclassified Tsukamurella]MDF0531997.1 flavodoxin domain-containing protein [Tsukamurella sp. 8J]MDF0588896.1 flavodoxin domain-containing protein [Tsukamurella sp. 8F]
MTALIVCSAEPRGNTRRIADAMASPLGAEIVAPRDVDPETLGAYDLVGFGSGIFWMSFHEELRALVEKLPQADTTAFVFATSGVPETPLRRYTRSFSRRLDARGYRVVDTFLCRGFDRWAPVRPLGINRHRPDDRDASAARLFAERLQRTVS